MADDRFKRFQHLERPRQPRGGDQRDQSPGTEGRFEALEERKPPGGAGDGPGRVADGHLERFRPAAERPLEIAPELEGELPFIRCAGCQMDHNRTATTCTVCGADLRTEEQRAFNTALAAERRSQAAAERSQRSELERAQREAGAEEARAKQAMGEAIAREVGDAERRRLDSEGLGGFGSAPGRGGWGGRWGSGWDGPGWSGGWGWGRRRYGFGLVGWLIAGLLRLLFGGRWR
jgi:hypothetical protein